MAKPNFLLCLYAERKNLYLLYLIPLVDSLEDLIVYMCIGIDIYNILCILKGKKKGKKKSLYDEFIHHD